MKKDDNTTGLFNDFSSNSCLSEEKLAIKPTKRDLRNAEKILSNFGLSKIKVPNFNNAYELQRWLKTTVMEFLSRGE